MAQYQHTAICCLSFPVPRWALQPTMRCVVFCVVRFCICYFMPLAYAALFNILTSIHAACRSAGVRFAVQRADELAVRFRQLSLPNNSTVVLQPDAGLLLSDVVSGALTKLARQAGAMVKVSGFAAPTLDFELKGVYGFR